MNISNGTRNFSSQPNKETSIFEQADFYKGETPIIEETIAAKQMMPWFDGNDSLGAFQSVMPKDISNLPQGASTFGIFEYVIYLDELFYQSWMAAAQMGNMGLCGGLMVTAFATRVAFMPLAIYSQMVGHKMKLLAPDTEQHMDNMKRYSKQGNKEAS
jgi:hypothetical protein